MLYSKRSGLGFGFLLFAFFATSPVGAGFEPWLMGPCAADARKLCADALESGGRIKECLRKHEKELSPGCNLTREGRRTEMAGAFQNFRKDCAADLEKFCRKPSAPKPGDSAAGPRACMRDHYAQLSPSCKSSFDAMSARRERMRAKPERKGRGKAAPSVEPSSIPTTSPSPVTSLEHESSDLAAAIAASRAIAIGRPLSPHERTLYLARVATSDSTETRTE